MLTRATLAQPPRFRHLWTSFHLFIIISFSFSHSFSPSFTRLFYRTLSRQSFHHRSKFNLDRMHLSPARKRVIVFFALLYYIFPIIPAIFCRAKKRALVSDIRCSFFVLFNPLVTDRLNMTGVTRVHAELGLTGQGVKVGIIGKKWKFCFGRSHNSSSRVNNCLLHHGSDWQAMSSYFHHVVVHRYWDRLYRKLWNTNTTILC